MFIFYGIIMVPVLFSIVTKVWELFTNGVSRANYPTPLHFACTPDNNVPLRILYSFIWEIDKKSITTTDGTVRCYMQYAVVAGRDSRLSKVLQDFYAFDQQKNLKCLSHIGVAIAQWWHAGLQVSRLNDRSCTWRVISTKFISLVHVPGQV